MPRTAAPQGRDAIQRDLDTLERGAWETLRRFSKAEGKVLPLGRGSPRYQHRLGDGGMGSSPAEKDLGVLGGEKLDTSRQRALAAQTPSRARGCIPSCAGSRAREGVLPPCPAL